MTLTDDDIVERGLAASALLQDPTFTSFVSELKDLLAASVMNTQPDQSKERSQLYYQSRALDDLIGIMGSYVQAKDQIAAKRDAEFLAANTQDIDS